MTLALGITAVTAIAAGSGGLICLASLIAVLVLVRQRLYRRSRSRHDEQRFHAPETSRWRLSGALFCNPLARPLSYRCPPRPRRPRTLQNDWAVRHGSHVPRPRLLRKIRESTGPSKDDGHPRPSGDGLRRFSSVHIKGVKISEPATVIPLVATPNRMLSTPKNPRNLEANDRKQHSGPSLANRGAGEQELGFATPLKPHPLFHPKPRSISSSAIDSMSQSPTWRYSPSLRGYGKIAEGHSRPALKRSWSIQYSSSGNAPSNPVPTPPRMTNHAKRNYMCYEDSPSRASTMSRTTVNSSILNGEFPSSSLQEHAFDGNLPSHCRVDQLRKHSVKGKSKVTHNSLRPSPRQTLLASPLKNPKPGSAIAIRVVGSHEALAQESKRMPGRGRGILYDRSARTSRHESELCELSRDKSSSLSISLVSTSISPLKAAQDKWVQQGDAKAYNKRISAREQAVIALDDSADDAFIFGYGDPLTMQNINCRVLQETSGNSRPPTWSQDAREWLELQSRLESTIAPSKSSRQAAAVSEPNLPSIKPSTLPPKQTHKEQSCQRVSLLIPMHDKGSGRAYEMTSHEQVVKPGVEAGPMNHDMGDPLPGLQIARPKPLRPTRPPSTSVFEPNIVFPGLHPSNLLSERQPLAILTSSLPNLRISLMGDSQAPLRYANADQRRSADEYDPSTPTMKPSKRRSQIDPKRLSNITNPPMYLQPTPTSQSSPFSYTATPTFAYKSRLEDDGAKENNTGLLFLAASPPSGAQTSSPETQTLTPLDRYSHLFDKFPARPSASSPSLLSHSEAQVRGRPSVPNWRLPQIQMATPASPRPTKKRLSGLNGPRPHLGSMNKPLSAAAYALASETRTKVKRKSRHRSNSPLRNVVTPSFEWQAPNHTDDVWTTDQPKIQSTESEQSADGNRGESWSIKSLETEAEKCDSLPPRTLQLVNQLRRMNSEYDGDGLFRMLQADVQTPAVSTELGTQVKSHCFAKDEDEIGVARTCDEPANNSKINMSTAEDTAGGHRRRNQIPDRSSQKANSDDLSDAGRSLQDRIRREARPSLDRSTSPPIKTEPTPSQTFTPPKEPLISQDESPTLGRANLFNFYNPTNGSTSKDSILNAPFFIAPNTSPSSSRACSPTLPGLPALTNVHTHVEPRPLSSFPTATSDSSDVSDAKGDKLLDLDPLDAELCATVSVPLRTAYAYAGPSVEDRANANATATRRSCRVQHEGRFGAIGSERERAGAGTGAGAHHRFPSCISPSFSALRGIRAVEGRGGGGGGGANRGGAAGIVVQHAEGSGDAGDPFSPAPVVARAAAWPTAFAGEGNAAANRAANPTANCNSNRLSGHVTRLGAPATGTGSGITPSASGSSFDPRVVGLGIGMLGRELEWSFD